MRYTKMFQFCVAGALVLLVAIGCGKRLSLANMTPQELFQIGKADYDQGKYIKAVNAFQTIVYNYPGESIVDTAQYYLALSYFGNDDFELAQVEFNRLAVNYPSSVYFEHAIFMKAVSFFESTPDHYGLDQTDLETAISQFEDFIIDFPESELVEEAQKFLLIANTRMARKYYQGGVVYERIGAPKSAKIYFQKVVDDYTQTEFAPKATFKIAEMEYKMKNFDEASRKFSDFAVVFSDHEWVDRAKEKSIEAAFKAGERAYKDGEFTLAKERFQDFIRNHPESDKAEKASEYIEKINGLPPMEAREVNANS